MLLHNILSALADRMDEVLTAAYIITPEDPLHVAVRAMQVWLEVNEVECYLHTHMTSSELDQVLRIQYRAYPALRPACTLTEEEAIILIRAQKRPALRGNQSVIPHYNHVEPGFSALTPPINAVPLLWIMQECALHTSLLELSHYTRFADKVRGLQLVTLGDPQGAAYSLLYHSWIFKPGYPY